MKTKMVRKVVFETFLPIVNRNKRHHHQACDEQSGARNIQERREACGGGRQLQVLSASELVQQAPADAFNSWTP